MNYAQVYKGLLSGENGYLRTTKKTAMSESKSSHISWA